MQKALHLTPKRGKQDALLKNSVSTEVPALHQSQLEEYRAPSFGGLYDTYASAQTANGSNQTPQKHKSPPMSHGHSILTDSMPPISPRLPQSKYQQIELKVTPGNSRLSGSVRVPPAMAANAPSTRAGELNHTAAAHSGEAAVHQR